MAIITMVVRGTGATASGFLAPPSGVAQHQGDDLFIGQGPWLAVQTSNAWGDETSVVRASVGRLGEEHLLQVDNRALLARTFAEAQTAPGRQQTVLVSGHVQRWAAPAAVSGRPPRAGRSREEADRRHARLALCGAALDGIGVAACIGSARRGGGQDHRRPRRLSAERLVPGGDCVIKPRDINETIRYTMWSVFRRTNMEPPPTRRQRRWSTPSRPPPAEAI